MTSGTSSLFGQCPKVIHTYYAMQCLLLFGFIAIAFAASSETEPGRQCNAPNNGGLNGILDNTKSLFNENEFLAVVLEYSSNDDQVRSIIEFLQSKDFVKMLGVLEKQAAFISLVETACKDLYLDVVYYINKTADRIGLPSIHIPQRFRSADPPTVGLAGMFERIAKVLPMEELNKEFEKQVKTDEYLQKALKFILSNDFKVKVETLTALPEYTVFLEKMYALDVDVDAIEDFVNGVYEKLGSYVINT